MQLHASHQHVTPACVSMDWPLHCKNTWKHLDSVILKRAVRAMTGTESAEDMAVDQQDLPVAPPVNLAVTQTINTAQAQHGLRHSDYARYRQDPFPGVEMPQQAAMQDMVRADGGSCGAGSIARESSIGCIRLSN